MKASGRRKFNEAEVIDVLQNFGFETVFPEELSFSEQISLFSHADFIIGGSGAAFTNLLFCNTSCKVIIFAKNTLPFSGFSTIASFVGFDLVYLTESSSYGEKNDNLHDSFVINTNKLIELIKTLN